MVVPFLGGASDLLTIVKSLTAAGSAGVDQDWAMLSANLATAVGKAGVLASKLSGPFSKIVKDPDNLILGSPTAILDLAGLAILLIDVSGGFGAPEMGDAVSAAAANFTDYAEKLVDNCTPDPRDWSGEGATAYTSQVNLLIEFTATMQEYDAEWQSYLSKQGEAVRSAHLCIATSFGVLTAATGVALSLYLIKPPPWGKFASMAFQAAVAVSVIAIVIEFELVTLSFSSMNLQDSRVLADKYKALSDEIATKMAGTYGQIGGAEAKKTSSYASDFQNISDGMSSYPDLSSLAAAATAAGDNVSPSQKVLLDAAAEQEAATYRSTDGAQAQTAAPATAVAAPSLPAFTPPSPAQALKTTVVAAAVTQSFSQNVVQPVAQRVQQVTQMAQSQQGAGPAAQDAPSAPPADETAAAGASAGTEGVQRAPIDVPAGGTDDAAAGRGQVL